MNNNPKKIGIAETASRGRGKAREPHQTKEFRMLLSHKCNREVSSRNGYYWQLFGDFDNGGNA